MAKSADPAEKEETFSLSSSDEVDDDDVANWVADASDSDAFDECVPEGLSEEGASGTAVQEAPEKGSNSSSSPPPPAHDLPPPPPQLTSTCLESEGVAESASNPPCPGSQQTEDGAAPPVAPSADSGLGAANQRSANRPSSNSTPLPAACEIQPAKDEGGEGEAGVQDETAGSDDEEAEGPEPGAWGWGLPLGLGALGGKLKEVAAGTSTCCMYVGL